MFSRHYSFDVSQQDCQVSSSHFIPSSDPRLQNSRLPNEAADTASRLVNFDFTLRSIRSFVQVNIIPARCLVALSVVMLDVLRRMCFAISLSRNCLISILLLMNPMQVGVIILHHRS